MTIFADVFYQHKLFGPSNYCFRGFQSAKVNGKNRPPGTICCVQNFGLTRLFRWKVAGSDVLGCNGFPRMSRLFSPGGVLSCTSRSCESEHQQHPCQNRSGQKDRLRNHAAFCSTPFQVNMVKCPQFGFGTAVRYF